MIELSYMSAFNSAVCIFILGIIYEYFASRFDYNTGKYIGKCIKWEKKNEE